MKICRNDVPYSHQSLLNEDTGKAIIETDYSDYYGTKLVEWDCDEIDRIVRIVNSFPDMLEIIKESVIFFEEQLSSGYIAINEREDFINRSKAVIAKAERDL